MVEYVGMLIRQYVAYAPTFPRFYVLNFLRDSVTPSSYGFTSFIESTTSWMSSLSNRNADNTRSVTVVLRLTVFYHLIVPLFY